MKLLEGNAELHPLLIMGMDYLVNISYVDVSVAYQHSCTHTHSAPHQRTLAGIGACCET